MTPAIRSCCSRPVRCNRLSGEFTLGEFCDLTDELDLFAREPEHGEVSRLYRRWTFQSAALDLALRQAGTTLQAKRSAAPSQPLTFVVSLAAR